MSTLLPLSALDAPGYEGERSKRRQRPIVSQGRGQPCTQQGMVVGTVRFLRDEYEKRVLNLPHKADDVVAPIGDITSFQAMQGEVAIARVNEYGATSNDLLNVDSELCVTTTVNGWPAKDDAIVVGVVRNARPLSSQDSAGTVAFVGTQTIVNTGPEDIGPGEIVYISLTPHTYTTERGVKRPAVEIQEPGTPGFNEETGEESSFAPKFRPATYSIRDNSVYSYIARGIQKVRAKPIFDLTQQNMAGSMKRAYDSVLDSYQAYDREMPARHVIALEVVSRALDQCTQVFLGDAVSPTLKAFVAPATGGFLKEVETLLEPYFEKKEKSRKKFLEAIGSNASEASRADWRPTKRRKTGSGATDENKDFFSILAVLQPLLADGKLECVCEQHNYLRKRVLGKCIRGAPPGGGMDIALGYTHT